MPVFKSEDAYFRFAESVSWSMRYVSTDDTNEFIESLRSEAEDRCKVIAEGTLLWRAQLGNTWEAIDWDVDGPLEVPAPLPTERMKPLQDRAVEGRANPKGIPYLYVSTHRETALAEVRPWIGAYVSVAGLVTVRDLRIVDCTEETKRAFYPGFAPPEYWDRCVWSDIDSAFSRPVVPTDDQSDYVPTQVIAEVFKASGFDGVAYRSSLGDGRNVALFDTDAALLRGCSVYQVEKMQFGFKLAGDSYQVGAAATTGG